MSVRMESSPAVGLEVRTALTCNGAGKMDGFGWSLLAGAVFGTVGLALAYRFTLYGAALKGWAGLIAAAILYGLGYDQGSSSARHAFSVGCEAVACLNQLSLHPIDRFGMDLVFGGLYGCLGLVLLARLPNGISGLEKRDRAKHPKYRGGQGE